MGYFNYFIKCIIRKFVNIFLKPKSMIIILVVIFFLYLWGGTSRAEWTDTQIEDVQTKLLQITEKLNQQITNLEWIENNTNLTYSKLTEVYSKLNEQLSYLIYINGHLANMDTDLDNINNSLTSIENDLDNMEIIINKINDNLNENHEELITELEKQNESVLEELSLIRDSLNGKENELIDYIDLGVTYNSTSNLAYNVKGISLNYDSGYTYTVKIHYKNTNSSSVGCLVYASDNWLPSGYVFSEYESKFIRIDNVPANASDYIVTYQVSSSNPKYIYFTWGSLIQKIEVYRGIRGLADSLNQSNDLQQQQNQIQQEQNDFMQQETQDSSIDINGFNNVESNDITSSGLSGVFTSIYNSISSWSSKDINLPIPYTNKSIVIPANYTNNMLNSVGGGWIIAFISAIYYFVVGRFIIYSITGIINSIKSGSILETDSKDNITTDML